jgi:pimeloyl-ACP methyl ester carboxylesterase
MQKSTAVRSRQLPWGVRMLRPALATLSAVSPTLAAPVAERLFLTPPRYPQPARERAALASARRTIIHAASPIATWTWGHGPRVLLVHGWGGRGAQLAAFVPPLLAAGYSVVTFDAPAHGTSPARESSVVAFVDAIHAVGRAVGPVHGVIAHSIGAAAMGCALRDGFPTDAAVFLAPPADLTLHADMILEALGFGRRARDLMRERVERRLGVPWSRLDVRDLAPRMRTPLLVVHDREDTEVPWQEGAMIAQAWPGATLSTTSGLGHRRIIRDAGVVRETVEFVRAQARGRVSEPAVAPERLLVSSVA